MLYKFENELRGAEIRATDDKVGAVEDFHFSDRDWVIRYVVVDTDTWLRGRTIVLSPASVERFDRASHAIQVNLTRAQIENSPEINVTRPLFPEQEAALASYYGWPAMGAVGAGPIHPAAAPQTAERAEGSQLRSAREIAGYYIHARDGDLGHVHDFILEDFIWTIRYLAIDTRNWWPGKKVLVAPNWIQGVDWANLTVHVDLTKEAIRGAPEYRPDDPIGRDYETELWSYYQWAPYWNE